MNTWLYLTTPTTSPDDWRFTWWHATGPSCRGTLQEAANAVAGQPLTLLLPIEMASYHHVEVPARSGRWLKHAIHSALEEQVLDELDTLHIARGPVQQKRYCRLFAINRDTLQTVLTGLADQGLQPREIYLDADCLPGDAPAAVWCNDRWLIGNLPTTRMALGEQERAELPTLLPENLPWQTPDDEDALLLQLHTTHAIDLRQGEFCYVAPKRLTWRLPMLMVTLCVGVLLAYTVGHRLVLEQQTAVLHEQNVSDFRQRFPYEQRIVNLRQQVAQRQEQPGGAPQGIARRLDQLAQNWIASGGAAAAIRHVQYQAGEGWTLQVSAPAFADLEQIRTGLTQQNLAVQSNSTVRDANGVSSQFKIGE